jgi:outer membrane receptor for ferrienterochelin and colicins
MKLKTLIVLLSLVINIYPEKHTDANIFGDVQSEGEHLPFANVYIDGTTIGTTTDETGHYMMIDLPEGKHTIVAQMIGYEASKKEITIEKNKSLEINFVLKKKFMQVDEVVVTGTKTFKRSTEAPIIVNVLDNKSIEAVQACNISEGLSFQPGLRVETDCQTCNYTQLRMNGLGGGYSQILINGRPIFSPLIGLYGMEQIPANMVDRIEVVRGGGSALYGSSAIGGTVNVLTKIPKKNDYSVSYTTHSINNDALDKVLNANVTMVSQKRNAGVVIFANNRHREAYDHEGITYLADGSTKKEKDNYSELPELRNNSFGANLFYKPSANQKIEANFTSLHEYRYGGEMIDEPAHFAQQSEERTHNILMGGLDYQINFNNDNSSFIAYLSGQETDRKHYTGLYPAREEYSSQAEFEVAEANHLKNPPYGTTDNTTFQLGTQLNHRFEKFLIGENIITTGLEFITDDIIDSIPEYRYGTNQKTENFAGFFQSDWKMNNELTMLLGLRADKHSLLDHFVFSPRLSLLYRLKEYTQFRLTWGTGFRAPQAFDADMHIAFAGGGISRISLADNLKEERSNSFSGSVNFDYPQKKYILGFTLEGFYTKLDDAFYLHPTGTDNLGDIFEKRNGPGATVKGATIELRANYDKKYQIEAGFTIQSSQHDEAVETIEGLDAKSDFLRTPEQYGYLILTFNPTKNFSASISNLYTGSMTQAKFSPDESIYPNEYRTSDSFYEVNMKLGYTFEIEHLDTGIEIFGGIKNMTDVYQADFDNFRNRDSNYMYGASLPRSFYIGVKLMTF